MTSRKELFERLAGNDEQCLRAMLGAHDGSAEPPNPPALAVGTRQLVQLAALVAVDASTPCLRWAVDRATAAGASDDAVVRVLITTGYAAGAVQTVTSAPRLALALDLDPAVELDSD